MIPFKIEEPFQDRHQIVYFFVQGHLSYLVSFGIDKRFHKVTGFSEYSLWGSNKQIVCDNRTKLGINSSGHLYD